MSPYWDVVAPLDDEEVGDLVGAAHLEAEAGWDSGVGEVRLVVVCQGFGVRPTET